MPLPDGTTLLGYRTVRHIKSGSFGEVHEATGPDGGRVAVKFIPKEKIVPRWLNREEKAVEAVSGCPHDGLVRVIEYGPTAQPAGYAFVMPLATGSLRDELEAGRRQDPVRVAEGVRLLAGGLDHLHRLDFSHGDVTPANVLLFGDAPALCDFGFAREGVDRVADITVRNSLWYAPPEFADYKSWGTKSDQFSLAATYLHLRTETLPLDKPFGSPQFGTLPQVEQDVLRRAMDATPDARYPTCLEFANALLAAVTPPPVVWQESVPRIEQRLSSLEGSVAALDPDRWKDQPPDPEHRRATWRWLWQKAKPWLPAVVVGGVLLLIGGMFALTLPKPTPPGPPTGFAREEELTALRQQVAAQAAEVLALRRQADALRDGVEYPTLFARALAAYQAKDYARADVLLDACPEEERQFEYHLLRQAVAARDDLNSPSFPPFTDHVGPVQAVTFSPDGSRIATGGDDKSVRAWDAVRGVGLFVVTEHGGPVNAVAYHPDGRRIASGSSDNTVRVCDADNRLLLPLETLTTDGLPVQSLAYDETGTVLAYSCAEPFIRVRNRDLLVIGGGVLVTNATYKLFREPPPNDGGNPYDPAKKYPFALRSDGRVIACTRATEELTLLIGTEAGSGYGPPTIGPAKTALAFSRDGNRLAVAYEWRDENRQRQRNGLAVWSLGRQRPIELDVTDNCAVTCVVFNPPANRVITGHTDGTLRVSHVNTGRELLALKAHEGAVNDLAVSPDGRRIVTGGADGKVLVWGTKSK